MTEKIKIKRVAIVVNDTYNTMYNPELIVKEIKLTKSNLKFRDIVSLEKRLSITKKFTFFEM